MNDVEVDDPQLLGPETVLSGADGPVADDARPKPSASRTPSARYEAKGLLGSGGMGEIRLCLDRTIGREVAMKVMRSRSNEPSDAQWRFVREARVQAQLEHPAIVPVYDLGVDAAGRPTFTMRRVRGTSLAAVLKKLASDDEATAKRFSQRRLLSLFVRLCDAVAYVHARGVLHRDIKPANVMLGDYGEIYLLDWGLAKVGLPDASARVERAHPTLRDASAAGTTAQGAVFGTPGYMAPEQLRDDGGPVGPWTDVFGLGLVLFEILSLVRAHADGTVVERIVQTLDSDGRSPIEAARGRATPAEIPVELDRLCVHATRRQPSDRLASAQALAEGVEAYLAGHRDSMPARVGTVPLPIADAREIEAAERGTTRSLVDARDRAAPHRVAIFGALLVLFATSLVGPLWLPPPIAITVEMVPIALVAGLVWRLARAYEAATRAGRSA